MQIVVTANGSDLDAPASPVFGRCGAYLFVDTETMGYEAVENPAIGTPSGAGIQAAQFVIERGAQAVLTGNVGPNAFGVLQASGVAVYLIGEGTVRQAVTAYKAGQLQSVAGANVAAHSGMAGGMGVGRGMGGGLGRGTGRGMGRGRGGGRGMGMGMGMGTGQSAWSEPSPAPSASRQDELATLTAAAAELRDQLAQVMERIENLNQEEP